MTSVFSHPWLGGLFADDAASALWSAEAQLAHYAAFEIALAHALEETGHVAKGQGAEAARAIARLSPSVAALAKGTAKDGLPIPDLVAQMRHAAGPAARAVHTGATSQDVMDTALALTLKAMSALLKARLEALDATLAALRDLYGATPMMGRTRMQAALPISVADRVESWRRPLSGHVSGLGALSPRIERLQLGGAVGNGAEYGKDHEAIAALMARALGLHPAPHVWHSDRSAIAEYGGWLSLVSGTLGKLGQDLCLMAQQGVDEVAISGGGGSSAMPHKANPVLAELLVTLARFNATQLAGLHQALVHEQERSGAAWMLEWMILPQMSVATARALAVAGELCGQITRLGGPR